MKSFVLSLGLALLITLPFAAGAEDRVWVVDGDGLKIGAVSIRLWGIDAPELDQTCGAEGQEMPCGEEARSLLGALVMAGNLICETKDTDRSVHQAVGLAAAVSIRYSQMFQSAMRSAWHI